MPSIVTAIPAADSAAARAHFAAALSFETDCWDVRHSLAAADFVHIDVRGAEAYARGHVPGAVHIPHGELTEARLRPYPAGTQFVLYCAGPHCNGAHRGALRLAQLGRAVKIMLGGISGWREEGYALEPAATARTAAI